MKRAAHSFMRSASGRVSHFVLVISSESRKSSWKAFSISRPKLSPSTITFSSLLCRKLRMSILVEPTVDQAPSMTAVLACSTASFK